MQLGNEKKILGACRSYRRACRKYDRARAILEKYLAPVPHSVDDVYTPEQMDLWRARQEMLAVKDRLLFFAETGSRANPHVFKR